MHLDNLGKEGFKLWVIWSKSPLAKGIRTFLFLATTAELVGFGFAYLWAISPWTLLLDPIIIWLWCYTFPLWYIRRQGRREMAEFHAQTQKEIDAFNRREETQRLQDEAKKRKDKAKRAAVKAERKRQYEEQALTGNKRNP